MPRLARRLKPAFDLDLAALAYDGRKAKVGSDFPGVSEKLRPDKFQAKCRGNDRADTRHAPQRDMQWPVRVNSIE